MPARKTPILLRKAPLTGEIMALHRYTRKTVRGREVLDAGFDGKQPVTDDFETLMLEEVMDPDAPDLISILDGAADGQELNDEERAQLRAVHGRLREMILRHNSRAIEEGGE